MHAWSLVRAPVRSALARGRTTTRILARARGAEIDALARQAADQVQTYAQHWQQIAGEPVVEQGLWFTASDCYVSL